MRFLQLIHDQKQSSEKAMNFIYVTSLEHFNMQTLYRPWKWIICMHSPCESL